jgi:WhiB family transcriptional regulator, redox-sensing transcriptional regulator
MRAACLHDGADLFFSDRAAGPEIDRAKQICGGCPVRARCLDWALSHGVASGIWGGRTGAERREMSALWEDQGAGQGSTGVRTGRWGETVDSGKTIRGGHRV